MDPAGLTHLLLDLRKLRHLGGSQMEDLTTLLSYAERKGLTAAMFGLRPEVRAVLRIMGDMTNEMPTVLEAATPEAALAESRQRSRA